MTFIKYTARQIHQHKAGLRRRIKEATGDSFLIPGNLAWVAGRYGDTVITGRVGEITILEKRYRLEETEAGVLLYTQPITL